MLKLAIAACLWNFIWGINGFYTLWINMNKPLVIGLYFGLVTGELTECVILGASIQAIYLGVIQPGGTMPTDASMAANISIPIAIASDMDLTTAMALAVPAGLLGSAIHPICTVARGMVQSGFDKQAEKGNEKGIMRYVCLYPIPVYFLFRGLPVFIAVYFGSSAAQFILDVIPDWILNGFSVAGGLLPAVGISLALSVINNQEYRMLTLFIMGFFSAELLGLSTIGATIFSVCMAIFIISYDSIKESKQL